MSVSYSRSSWESWQSELPHLPRGNDREHAAECKPRGEELAKQGEDDRGRVDGNAEQHDTWCRLRRLPKDQGAEVSVECQQDAVLAEASLKHRVVRVTSRVLGRVGNVVSPGAEFSDDGSREILVGQVPLGHSGFLEFGSRYIFSSRNVSAA